MQTFLLGFLMHSLPMNICRNERLQRDYSNHCTWKKIIQSQGFLKTKHSQVIFANGPITWLREFKGCFLRGQVCLNGFKVFNGCIVESWILLVHLQNNLRTFCFQKMMWLDNLLPSTPVLSLCLQIPAADHTQVTGELIGWTVAVENKVSTGQMLVASGKRDTKKNLAAFPFYLFRLCWPFLKSHSIITLRSKVHFPDLEVCCD